MQAVFKNGRFNFSGGMEFEKIKLYSIECEVKRFCFHKIAIEAMAALPFSAWLS